MKSLKKSVICLVLVAIVTTSVLENNLIVSADSRISIENIDDFTKYLRENLSDVKSDKQGRYLLYMYLYGVSSRRDLPTKIVKIDGVEKEYPIVSINNWGNYLKKEKN